MGLFGGSKKKSYQLTSVDNSNETQNLAAQDGQVAGRDLRIYHDELSDDVVKEAFSFGKDANYVNEQVLDEAFEFGETSVSAVKDIAREGSRNMAELADEALLFGDESQERIEDLARLSFENNFSTVDKVIEGFLGNQEKIQDHAAGVQNYAMQSLAASKGVEQPVFSKNLVIALAIVAGAIVFSTQKIFKG